MAFPSSPVNNQTTVVNGITYTYNSTVGSWTRITNNTLSGNITTTGNIVANGAYISGNAIIGGNLQVTGNVTYLNYDTITYTETANAIVANIVTVSGNISAGNVIISGTGYSSNIVTGNITAGNVLANLYGTHFGNTVGTTATYSGNVTAGNIISNLYSPVVNINSTSGGYNVLNITGAALPAYGSQSWSFFTQNLRLTGGAGSWILFPDSSTQTTAYPGTLLSGTSTLAISTLNAATIGNTGAALTGTTLSVLGTTSSTGTSSGALQVAGGVGVGGDIYVGGNVVVTGNVISGTGNIVVQTFTGNSGQFYGNAAGFGALYAGIPSGYAATPDTIIQSAGNFNSYVQNNSQNINAGSQATTDWVATASNGTDTIYYVDLGIAGGGYSNASPYNSLGTSLWPNDAYLYAQGNVAGTPGGNLVVGTSIPGTVTRILAGGVNSSNVVATFANTGVTVSGNLTAGNILASGLFWANGNVMQTGGGSITYTANTSPPASGNTVGSQWYNTTTDTLYEYVTDGTSNYWVDIQSPTALISNALAIVANTVTSNQVNVTGNITATTISANIVSAYNGNTYVTGNLIPTSNVSYNLGSPTQRFQSLYLSGNTIDLGGATIKTDVTSGAIAFVPLPTTANPNPVATVVSPAGTITTVVTTGGNIAAGALSTASNSASTGGNLTIGNLTVSNTTIHTGNIGFSATGSAPLATLDMSARTDAVILPVGNTAQRPATASNGMARFNTTIGAPEWYSGTTTTWQPFYLSPAYTVNYLIVAGGGAGGVGVVNVDNGGGGGAGGMITGTSSLTATVQYTITVGAGGAGSSTSANGAPSTFNSITALGGGGGGYTTAAAYSGGSGGGAGSDGVQSGGSGTSGQGNAGGSSSATGPAYGTGGGGGAGGAGANGTSSSAGAGGVGLQSSITGTATYYAGGGGGSASASGDQAAGGLGGGGGGGANSPSVQAGTAGTANTGGGGGGSNSASGTVNGPSGGSGIVIISYVNATQRGSGGTVTTYGSGASTTWVHTFTSSGIYYA